MTIKSIQGLRAVAALLVVGVHLGNPNGFEHRYLNTVHPLTATIARMGYFGVDLFFIISGFIMIVTTFRDDDRSLTPLDFITRRAIRIYPPLWIINTFVLIVHFMKPSLVNAHSSAPTNIAASYLLLPQAGSPLVLVAWTLVYEMFFYVIFALGLIWGAKGVAVLLTVWAAAIAAANAVHPNPNSIYASFLENQLIYEFLIGTLIGYAARLKPPLWSAAVIGSISIIVFGALATEIACGRLPFPDGYARVASALPLAGIVLAAVTIERIRGAYTPRALEALGDASYSLYLWHIPVLTVVGLALHALHPHTAAMRLTGLCIACAAIVVLSLAVFRYIEVPVTTWLRYRSLS